MAQKIKNIIIALTLLAPVFFAVPVFADTTPPPACGHNCGTPITPNSDCQSTTGAAGTVDTTEVNKCLRTNPIVRDLNLVVDFLSGVVGIAVVGTIVLGGVQYSMAGDNPQSVTAAKKRITNGLIALAGFIFTFAFLQWLIPGGILHK